MVVGIVPGGNGGTFGDMFSILVCVPLILVLIGIFF